jgi:hypothetical protein
VPTSPETPGSAAASDPALGLRLAYVATGFACLPVGEVNTRSARHSRGVDIAAEVAHILGCDEPELVGCHLEECLVAEEITQAAAPSP